MSIRLSKKLQNLLDTHGPALYASKELLEKNGNSPFVINTEIEIQTKAISEKLLNFSMRELRRVEQELTRNLQAILLDNLETLKTNQETDSENIRAQNILNMKIKIVEETIKGKQEYQRQFTHPVERNIIDHGLFSTSMPMESTLVKLRNKEGVIQRHKNGFSKLYYENKNGTLLTPYDSKVLISLFKLWMNKGKSQKFTFRFDEIIKAMQAHMNGGEYVRISESLENLARTSIIMEEYLNPQTGKRSKTGIHNPIQTAVIDRESNEATIEFSNYIHDSLLAGNYITINMMLFNDLATPTSRNLYINIINKLPDDVRSLDIDALIEHLDLHSSARNKAVTLLKQAFEELNDFDVISSFEVEKKGRKAVRVHFIASDWLSQQKKLVGEDEQLSFL